MKKILTMALAAMTIFAVSATAQTPEKKCEKKCEKTENCEKKGDKKCDKKCGRQCAPNPFEGLNLTEDQQTKLKAITPPDVVMKEAKKGSFDKGINPREFSKTVRADYLKQVKGVLTAEQYTQFLENFYVNQAGPGQKQGAKGKKGGHDRRGPKGGPDRVKADRDRK